MKEHIWNCIVNKKVLKPNYVLDFRFFKVAPFALMTALHTLGIYIWHNICHSKLCSFVFNTHILHDSCSYNMSN